MNGVGMKYHRLLNSMILKALGLVYVIRSMLLMCELGSGKPAFSAFLLGFLYFVSATLAVSVTIFIREFRWKAVQLLFLLPWIPAAAECLYALLARTTLAFALPQLLIAFTLTVVNLNYYWARKERRQLFS